MKKTYITAVIASVVAIPSVYWAKEKIASGAFSFVYGYPVLLVEETKQIMLSKGVMTNQFTHSQDFPDHEYRNVVRPNNDTLYSSAWLDLSKGPVMLSVPEVEDRYYVMPLMDALTNVFASVGTRETGIGAGRYLITGPDWGGSIPSDAIEIESPTNTVWMIGRIQTNGKTDIPAVRALQKNFKLSRSSVSKSMEEDDSVDEQLVTASGSARDPNQTLLNLSASEFLNRLRDLLNENSVQLSDPIAMQKLDDLGVLQLGKSQAATLNRLELWLVEKGMSIAMGRMKLSLEQREPDSSGWMVLREGLGKYHHNYGLRAAVAMVGLGALPPEEAVYATAKKDSKNRVLSGSYPYKIHFDKQSLPQVEAFWSLALYNPEGFFIDNSIQRYSIGDRDNLTFNDDGSLTLLVQNEPPKTNTSNWLPSPEGPFDLTMRLYLPKQGYIQKENLLPPIVRYEKPM